MAKASVVAARAARAAEEQAAAMTELAEHIAALEAGLASANAKLDQVLALLEGGGDGPAEPAKKK